MAATVEKKKAKSITKAQRRVMMEVVEVNPGMNTGNFNAPNNEQKKAKAWGDLGTRLNSMGGRQENDWKAWQKSFADWKSEVKNKAKKLKVHGNGTGGGPRVPPLNELEELCLSKFIFQQSLEGFDDVHDSLDEEQERQQRQPEEQEQEGDTYVVMVEGNDIKLELDRTIVQTPQTSKAAKKGKRVVAVTNEDDCGTVDSTPLADFKEVEEIEIEVDSQSGTSRLGKRRYMVNPCEIRKQIAKRHKKELALNENRIALDKDMQQSLDYTRRQAEAAEATAANVLGLQRAVEALSTSYEKQASALERFAVASERQANAIETLINNVFVTVMDPGVEKSE